MRPPVRYSCYFKNLDDTLSHHRKALPRDMPMFIFFTAPWCPDCVSALPVINDIFATGFRSDASLLRCIVGKTREEWKDPQHPLRSDLWGEHTGVTAIPTLVFLGTVSSPLTQPKVFLSLEKIDPEETRSKVESFLKEHGCRLWELNAFEGFQIRAWLERTFKDLWSSAKKRTETREGKSARQPTSLTFSHEIVKYVTLVKPDVCRLIITLFPYFRVSLWRFPLHTFMTSSSLATKRLNEFFHVCLVSKWMFVTRLPRSHSFSWTVCAFHFWFVWFCIVLWRSPAYWDGMRRPPNKNAPHKGIRTKTALDILCCWLHLVILWLFPRTTLWSLLYGVPSFWVCSWGFCYTVTTPCWHVPWSSIRLSYPYWGWSSIHYII